MRIFSSIASLSIGVAILLGAVGAHLLESRITTEALAIFNKAVFYHLTQSLGLLVLSIYFRFHIPTGRLQRFALGALASGIFVFCGSLYIYSALSARWVVHLAPVGGSVMILSWFILAGAFLREQEPDDHKYI